MAIEARRRGEETWRTLSVSANEGRLTALLDDDASLPATYEIRGYAIDAVGNERTRHARGDSQLIQLPVRQGSRLSVGKPKRTRGVGRRSTRVLQFRFGARVPMRGRVTDAFGKGRAHVAVEVSERVALPGVAWRPLTTLTTDKNGSFTYTAPKGVARTVRFQYAGTPTTRAAGSEVANSRACGFDAASEPAEPPQRRLRGAPRSAARPANSRVREARHRPGVDVTRLADVRELRGPGPRTASGATATRSPARRRRRATGSGRSCTQEESYPYAPACPLSEQLLVRGAG